MYIFPRAALGMLDTVHQVEIRDIMHLLATVSPKHTDGRKALLFGSCFQASRCLKHKRCFYFVLFHTVKGLE